MKDSDPISPTTRLPVETKILIESALFHFWNCDGECGMLHSAMAKLAAHVGFDGGVSGEAEEIAAYIDKRVPMTMEIHND